MQESRMPVCRRMRGCWKLFEQMVLIGLINI